MPTIDSSQLQVNQPIEAEDATLTVTAHPDQPLPVGAHTFELVVSDDSGNQSQPARVRLVIVDDRAPTAVITAPDRVSFGTAFTLSGAHSVDVGGEIVRYVWTLVG